MQLEVQYDLWPEYVVRVCFYRSQGKPINMLSVMMSHKYTRIRRARHMTTNSAECKIRIIHWQQYRQESGGASACQSVTLRAGVFALIHGQQHNSVSMSWKQFPRDVCWLLGCRTNSWEMWHPGVVHCKHFNQSHPFVVLYFHTNLMNGPAIPPVLLKVLRKV